VVRGAQGQFPAGRLNPTADGPKVESTDARVNDGNGDIDNGG